jgi:hypothetical protein
MQKDLNNNTRRLMQEEWSNPKKNMKPYKKFLENLAYLVENHSLTYLNTL